MTLPLIRQEGNEVDVGPLKANHALAAAGATAVGLLGTTTYVAFKALGLSQPLIATLFAVPIMVSVAIVAVTAVTAVALSYLSQIPKDVFNQVAKHYKNKLDEKCVIL